MLNTKHAKYEGLTPPELGEKTADSKKSGFLPKSLIYLRKTIGNQGKTRVTQKKPDLPGSNFFLRAQKELDLDIWHD